jgi:GNAT superfamily N-acetyltransferase
MITIHTGNAISAQTVKTLWDKIPFSQNRSLDAISQAIAQTQLFVHAWDGLRLVATARVLTDGVYYATIWDVIVDPDYQGQGIGRRVIKAAVTPLLGQGFSFIALFAADGKEEFYAKLGFVRHARGMTLDATLWLATSESG